MPRGATTKAPHRYRHGRKAHPLAQREETRRKRGGGKDNEKGKTERVEGETIFIAHTHTGSSTRSQPTAVRVLIGSVTHHSAWCVHPCASEYGVCHHLAACHPHARTKLTHARASASPFLQRTPSTQHSNVCEGEARIPRVGSDHAAAGKSNQKTEAGKGQAQCTREAGSAATLKEETNTNTNGNSKKDIPRRARTHTHTLSPLCSPSLSLLSQFPTHATHRGHDVMSVSPCGMQASSPSITSHPNSPRLACVPVCRWSAFLVCAWAHVLVCGLRAMLAMASLRLCTTTHCCTLHAHADREMARTTTQEGSMREWVAGRQPVWGMVWHKQQRQGSDG